MKRDALVVIGVILFAALMSFVDYQVDKLGRYIQRAACLHHHSQKECP